MWGQSGLPLWGSYAGEGAAGGRRLGQRKVAGSLVASPWLKPCADAWVGNGGGCQGARGDSAPGQIGKRRPTLLNLHGQGGGQHFRRLCQNSIPATDRISQNLRIWMGKKIVNMSLILQKHNTETEKLRIEEKCLECSI